MAVAGGKAHDQLGDVLGQSMAVDRVIGQEDLRDTGHFGRGIGCTLGASTGHQDMDIAADLLGSGHGMEGR